MQAQDKVIPRFKTSIDLDKCIKCGRCSVNCPFGVIEFDREQKKPVVINTAACVACQRCSAFCPVDAISTVDYPVAYAPHGNWTPWHIRAISEQAKSGGVLTSGMSNDRNYPVIFDSLVWDACQVTNPSIDALREPVETRTFLGRKPDKLDIKEIDGKYVMEDTYPNVLLKSPLTVGHMSLGSISYNAYTSVLRAVAEVGTLFGTGEGGLHQSHQAYKKNTISEIASGRFGVSPDYLRGAAIEIKIGQGAKPGHGGQLPGEKVTQLISRYERDTPRDRCAVP
jgi:glutamate synthase domain-containing protein 2/NAD-dependent dihydropyrimidine dehydrogenase PreA subunit